MGLFSFFKKQSDQQVQNQNMADNQLSPAADVPAATPPVNVNQVPPSPAPMSPSNPEPVVPPTEPAAPAENANDVAGDSLDGAQSDSGSDSGSSDAGDSSW